MKKAQDIAAAGSGVTDADTDADDHPTTRGGPQRCGSGLPGLGRRVRARHPIEHVWFHRS